MTPLATAIKYLHAVRVGRTEYAYYDDATQDFWIASSQDLRDLGRRLQRRVPDAYSLWCADTLSWQPTDDARHHFGLTGRTRWARR